MMTLQECENREHPHNQRCRFTSGFLCEDCRTFFDDESPTYIRYELPHDLFLVIHNIGADFARMGMEVPQIIVVLCRKLVNVPRNNDDQERENILNEALRFISPFKKTSKSAGMTLKHG